MRLPRAAAVVTSIVAIALAVAPGTVSMTPTTDTPPASGDFRPLSGDLSGSATAATNPVPASANDSQGRLDGGGGILVDPEAAHQADAGTAGSLPWSAPAPEAEVPDPSPVVVVRPTPTPRPVATAALTSGSGGLWKRSEASFYGPGFYGNGLACPGILTTTLQGVAHKTLPCGTLVTFRNPRNGIVLTVPVVDRGPYVAGREWDLTGGACVILDFCYTGIIEWRFAG